MGVPIFDSTSYSFSAYAVPVAITAVLMLAFGARVMIRRWSRVSVAFFGMTAAAFVWLVAFTLMYSTREESIALFWARVAYLGVPFIAPGVYQFSVELLRINPQRRLETLQGWLLALFFSIIGVKTGLLVTHVEHYSWGFYPRYGVTMSIPFLAFFFGYLIAAMVELARAYPVARGTEQKRIRLLLIGFGIAYLGCVDYLAKFGVPLYPFGYIPLLAFVGIAATAFRRYDLVAITPSLAASGIISTMADALFVCDREGRIQFANRAVETLLGYNKDSLIGSTLDAVLASPNDDPFAGTLRRKTVRTEERVFVTKNGEMIDMMISISPINHHGEVAGAVVIARDVRERKEAEREIRKAVTLLESTLDSTADGIIVTDHRGKVLSYNQRFADMWRIPTDLLAGADDRTITAFVVDQLMHPNSFIRTIESLYAQPEAESFDLLEFKDGRRFERYSMGRKIEGVATIRVWSFRDVTARFAAEAAVRDSELRYRLLFEQNAAGVCVTTEQGAILECNSIFAEMLGYGRLEMAGLAVRDLFVRPLEYDELGELLRDALTLNSVELELKRKDGRQVWVLENLTLSGERIHLTLVDISDRKRAEEQIEFHAYHDVLTQLPNRKLFTDRLGQAVTHARRTHKPLAVMFVDLDHFKTINDTLGHTGGDELLLAMSHRLKACVRDDDTVARIGGDEFTIILSELRQPEDAATVAEKILAAVQEPVTIGGLAVEISASVGIAIYPTDGIDPDSLLRNADSAMYRAKEAGRNTYQLCTDEMKRRATERLSLETRLRRAVQEDQLMLHYQPQISLTTGRIVGAEALIRWNDPERGLVHPSAFVPLAEESRLILPIGEWVLNAACRQMREWRDAGLDLERVSVNLSARQLQQQDFVEVVRRVLIESGIPGSALELEITETTAMQNADMTVEVLNELRQLGVAISIDDFGTGYSSLNYLKRFPISTVKIDGAFIHEVVTSESDAAIVSAVISIARSLDLQVIAEGVETEEQLAFLRRRRCDTAQGYLFSRPVSAEKLGRLLHERRTLSYVHPRTTSEPSA
jgi:diguanylate cyclase (GGDEF)-like protein/PAS domain S-box-containing protein